MLLYVFCHLQGNLTMRLMKIRMNSLGFTMQEMPPSMNASRKSNNKQTTRTGYLLVSQTTIYTKCISVDWLCTVLHSNASVTIFLRLNAVASFYQCPNRGGVGTWGPSPIVILFLEKGLEQVVPTKKKSCKYEIVVIRQVYLDLDLNYRTNVFTPAFLM